MKKIVIFISIILIPTLISLILVEDYKFKSYVKKNLSSEQIYKIKKYLLPYRLIDQQKNMIIRLDVKSRLHEKILDNQNMIKKELDFKKSMKRISTTKDIVKLKNNNSIEKIYLNEGFYSGINLNFPGSGYIDFYKNNLFLLSSKGILAYFSTDNQFHQIQNNLNNFLSYESMSKGKVYHWFSFKDLLIIGDNIFVSYTEERQKDCWNTSILKGKIDLNNIKFEKFFSPSNCIHSLKNLDNEFNAHQSGGKMVKSEDESIFFSIGDYRSRYLAQDIKSVNGKIININLVDGSYKIVSLGHRNPQGLYYDKEKKTIIETEHGPYGGDEVNIIDVQRINQNETLNYGWPISSAGEHYGGKSEKNKIKYQKYPLYKSHKDYGFIEPIYSFTPSIGISEIVKLRDDIYLFGSMNHQSLYIAAIDEKNNFKIKNKIFLGERVRDLKVNNNNVYLFLENSASVGIISFN